MITQSVRDLLDKNNSTNESTHNNKEELEMAEKKKMTKVEEMKAKRDAELAAKKAEEEKKANTKVEEKKAETPEEVSKKMDDLLNQSMAKNEQGKTNLFDGDENTENKEKEEMTAEEKEAEAAKLLRQAAINEHNKEQAKVIAMLKSKASGTEITIAQQTMQVACSEYFICNALIAENSDTPEISISRRYLKDDEGNEILQSGATPADLRELAVNPNTTLKKSNIVQFEANLKYLYKRPSRVLGGVITIPAALNMSVEDFTSGDLVVPKPDEIAASAKVNLVLDFETLFAYIQLFCGGTMKEHPILKDGDFSGASVGTHKLMAQTINRVSEKNGRKESTRVRTIKPAGGRSAIFVKENVVPIKYFETVSLDELNNDTDTLEALENVIMRGLSKKKGEHNPAANFLSSIGNSLMTYVTDDNGNIQEVGCKFLTGEVTLGQGEFAAYALKHWSDSGFDYENKREYKIVANNPVVRYSKRQNKQDPTKHTFRKVSRTLSSESRTDGEGISFIELAGKGYKAAQVLLDIGVTEDQVYELYTNYQNTKRRQRELKALESGTGPVRKATNVVDQALAARLLIQELQGNDTGAFEDYDASAIQKAIIGNVFHVNK